jgi:hypothetical protein
MFNYEWCKGCIYNTNKYAQGCECYTEAPYLCDNYTSKDEKYKKNQIETMIKMYEKSKVKFNAFSGACGKFTTET